MTYISQLFSVNKHIPQKSKGESELSMKEVEPFSLLPLKIHPKKMVVNNLLKSTNRWLKRFYQITLVPALNLLKMALKTCLFKISKGGIKCYA